MIGLGVFHKCYKKTHDKSKHRTSNYIEMNILIFARCFAQVDVTV
jgi:hypothetical protein